MPGSGGEVSRFFSPVSTDSWKRLAQIGEVSSLIMRDRLSAVHAIILILLSSGGALISAIFFSPQPRGDMRNIAALSRRNAM
jgi:hypothetical protein